MQNLKQVTKPNNDEKNMFGNTAIIKVSGSLDNMRHAVTSLRAAVISTSFKKNILEAVNSNNKSFRQENQAMREYVIQPLENESIYELKKRIANNLKANGLKINRLKSFWRNFVLSHRVDLNYIFTNDNGKMEIIIKYRKNGGTIIINTSGDYENRENKIADLIILTLVKMSIPFSFKCEENLI